MCKNKQIPFLLEEIVDPDIGGQELVNHGLVQKRDRVKILGNGSLTAKLEVKAHSFSKSAEAAITEAQGTVLKL